MPTLRTREGWGSRFRGDATKLGQSPSANGHEHGHVNRRLVVGFLVEVVLPANTNSHSIPSRSSPLHKGA